MPQPTPTTSITHALDLADARHWTRKPPTRPATRLRHLLTTQPLEPLAARIFAYPAAVARWAEGDDLSDLNPTHAVLIEREIYRSWQPDVRRRAHQQILDHNGCVTAQLHARFTYTTPNGEFPDARLQRITEDLPALHASRLFEARHAQADDDELRRILADGIGEAHFFRALPHDQQQAALTINDLHLIQFYY
ncbi:telomere-protecting terminal protein Tpg [Streptomyces sp. NPDC058385]|uniref:telomere-protecting terminal protein Tpg n=1 Tax=Streptomyces sp. NPDC058385 TaxID=3346473 RepID=UPI0036661BCD